ncbi:MAG: Hsp20/alpha crystallin family protein [Candidatus Methylomirabilales bacterium]
MRHPAEDIEREFQQLRDRLAEMMETLLNRGRPTLVRGSSFKPPIDVYETSAAVIIVMEIAGAKGEDIEVTLEGNRLRIAGVRRVAAPADAQRCHQMEIEFGPFERWVNLDYSPLRDAVEATYRDGFLHITIPKQAGSTATTVRILSE